MARVLTNNTTLQYTLETSPGVAGTTWHLLEPNTIGTFGSTITTVARDPISKNRQRRKGAVVDLDSAIEFDADLTHDHFVRFAECFLFSTFSDGETVSITNVDGTANEYDKASGTTLTSGTLVFARGFTNDANNGLKVVDTGATATTIPVTDTGLVDETPPSNAVVEVAGVESAAGDLDVDANGNLTSTVLDFTTLGLTVGQIIHVGGQAAISRFTNSENFGYARVVGISANLLTLDKKSQAFVTEANAAQTVQLLFGRYLRNVPVDDADYSEQSVQFEMTWPNLQNPSGTGDEYEYSIGNLCNEMVITLPLTDKATVSFGFVGQDTEVPTTSRKTGASTPIDPLGTAAYGTSSDIARLRVQKLDETGLTTCFKSVTLTLNNQVSPEKCLGTLGATFLNTGNFLVDVEAQTLFTDSRMIDAIRNHETLTMDFILTNGESTIAVDIPAMTFGDGSRELPVNESVLINLTGQAFADPVLNTSIGISLIPFVPV